MILLHIVIVHELLLNGLCSNFGLHSLPSRSSWCPRTNAQPLLTINVWTLEPVVLHTDYGRPERKYPSLHGRKFNTNPKFLGMAKAYFVGPIFQMFIYLISILWNTSLLSLHHFNPYSCITPATAKLKIPDTITRLAFDSLIDFQDELQNSKDVQTVKSVPAHFLMSSQNSWKMW